MAKRKRRQRCAECNRLLSRRFLRRVYGDWYCVNTRDEECAAWAELSRPYAIRMRTQFQTPGDALDYLAMPTHPAPTTPTLSLARRYLTQRQAWAIICQLGAGLHGSTVVRVLPEEPEFSRLAKEYGVTP